MIITTGLMESARSLQTASKQPTPNPKLRTYSSFHFLVHASLPYLEEPKGQRVDDVQRPWGPKWVEGLGLRV